MLNPHSHKLMKKNDSKMVEDVEEAAQEET
jgi:hypothetical protein